MKPIYGTLVDRNRKHLVLRNSRYRNVAITSHCHGGPICGVNRKALHAVHNDRFDIRNLRYPKRGQLLLRQMANVERCDFLN